MAEYDYEKWWSSLKVAEKELVAYRSTKRLFPYPSCTKWWVELPEFAKHYIRLRCDRDEHGRFVCEIHDTL